MHHREFQDLPGTVGGSHRSVQSSRTRRCVAHHPFGAPRRHLREQSLAGVLGFVARGRKSRRNSYVAGGSKLSPRHTVSQVARRWHVHRMRFHQILHELCPQRMLRKQPTAEPCLLPERYGGQAERLGVEAAQVRRNERDDSTSGRRTTDQFWPRRGSSELRIRRK